MDTETLKTLYGSCKAYTMLLTDLLDEKEFEISQLRFDWLKILIRKN